MFAGFAQAHRIVYGFVDAGGIHYQRYLRWKYVNWAQIESIARDPMGTISINVEGQSFFSRHLMFIKDKRVFEEQSNSINFDGVRAMWVQAKQFAAGSSEKRLEV
jgi:hypothetical protein